MTWSQASNRGIHLGCVAVMVTALTVGVGAPQPGRSLVSIQSYPARLEAAVVGTVANSPAAPALDSPAAATVAAATDDPNAIPRTIAQIAFTAVGIAVSPLWYLGFPITLPLAATVMANSLGVWGGLGYAAGLVYSPVFWAAVPFLLGAALAQVIFPFPTATVTPAAATSRPHTGAEVSRPLRRTQVNPAAATPQRSAKPAAAAKKPKAAGAASKRRAVA